MNALTETSRTATESQPLVSVVFPVKNGERWIRSSLESIAAQTLRDFEVVLIDDGCLDATIEIARQIPVPSLRVLVGPQRGLGAALALGVSASRGTYIARQDVDDISMPTRLARQVDYLNSHPEVVAYGSSAVEIDEAGRRIGTIRVPISDSAIRLRMVLFNPMIHSSVLLRRSSVLAAGSYQAPGKAAYPEDFDLWTRLAGQGSFANSQEPLVAYRQSSCSVSGAQGDELSRATGEIALTNVRRILADDSYRESDLELITFFHRRTRRITLNEMLRLERLLIKVGMRAGGAWGDSGWGRDVCLRPLAWTLRDAGTLRS